MKIRNQKSAFSIQRSAFSPSVLCLLPSVLCLLLLTPGCTSLPRCIRALANDHSDLEIEATGPSHFRLKRTNPIPSLSAPRGEGRGEVLPLTSAPHP